MLCCTDGEYILTHRAVYVVSCFRCSAVQMELVKSQCSYRSTRKIHFHSMVNTHIDVFIIIRKIFTLFLFTLNIEISRTFSRVLENFQKNARTLLPA